MRYMSTKFRRIDHGNRCKSLNGCDFASAHSEISNLSFQFAKKNKDVLANDYYILKYEDLLKDRAGEMKKVCDFLCIDFDKALMVQTRFGKKCEPSSSYKSLPSDKDRLSKIYGVISPMEMQIILWHGAPVMEFGYNLSEYAHEKNRRYLYSSIFFLRQAYRLLMFLMPLKNELLKEYFFNRLSVYKRFQEARSGSIDSFVIDRMNARFSVGETTQD